MALDTNALCTVNDVTNFIGTDNTEDRDLFESLINSVSTTFASYCDRHFESATYTEYYDGKEDQQVLYTKEYPITSVSGLWDDTEWAWADATKYAATDYMVSSDGLSIALYPSYEFYEGRNNIKITYVAGYSTIPADLKQACVNEVVRLFKRRNTIDVSAITMSDGSITVLSDDLMPTTRLTLAKYKRYGIA